MAIFAILLILLTTLPYLVAWSNQGDHWRFSGFLFGAEDGYSYLGKMRLGARGLWDFYLFNTPEPHPAAPLIFLPYILPGQITRLFVGADNPALPAALAVAFQVIRVICDALFIFALYRFIAAFLHRPTSRLLALALATLGGGLGWLFALRGMQPPEWYIPEGFSFLVLFGLPHLALSRAAMLAGLLVLFRATEHERWIPDAALAGALWWIVGLAVPFYLVIVYLILGAWGLAVWIRTRAFPARLAVRCIVSAGLTLPLFAYFSYQFSANAAFALWSAQNQLASPPLFDYVQAYILLLIPALIGARWAWRRARWWQEFALLVGWPLVAMPFLYLPINVQRRMGEAILVPLAILAAGGLEAWARAWAFRRRGRSTARRLRNMGLALTLIASLSAVFFLFASFLTASHPGYPLFRPVEELAAFAWLNANAAPDDVVLANFYTGNPLPAYTNQRPFFGHGPETLHWQDKSEAVERFYGDLMSDDERAALFHEYAIRYIFYGPLERQRAETTSDPPTWTRGLTLVYDAAGYQIYEIDNP